MTTGEPILSWIGSRLLSGSLEGEYDDDYDDDDDNDIDDDYEEFFYFALILNKASSHGRLFKLFV